MGNPATMLPFYKQEENVIINFENRHMKKLAPNAKDFADLLELIFDQFI